MKTPTEILTSVIEAVQKDCDEHGATWKTAGGMFSMIFNVERTGDEENIDHYSRCIVLEMMRFAASGGTSMAALESVIVHAAMLASIVSELNELDQEFPF